MKIRQFNKTNILKQWGLIPCGNKKNLGYRTHLIMNNKLMKDRKWKILIWRIKK